MDSKNIFGIFSGANRKKAIVSETVFTTASFEIAPKMVQYAEESNEELLYRPFVYLNGIPSVIAGDGEGHSYIYRAVTKDGTDNAYQKNADGTFKKDKNGRRISNISRDAQTGMALKGAKLIDIDVADCNICGGANGKSVEDVYVEIQQGGSLLNLIAGCRGGNSGYNEKGEEVGLNEVRMFGGGIFQSCYLGNDPASDAVKTMCARNIFMGFDGTVNNIVMGGYAGVVGSEEKYKNGYYNCKNTKYTDADGKVCKLKGAWKESNVNVSKKDYCTYYESANSYFNGEGSREFLGNPYYVDPYDEHYTGYCLIGGLMPQNIYIGTKQALDDLRLNRVYGNQYLRCSAYGLRYDAQLDGFVDDYNAYKGFDAIAITTHIGCASGALYGDARLDLEGVYYRRNINIAGGRNYGKVYIDLYKQDEMYRKETRERVLPEKKRNVKIKNNFYPKWCLGAAWALALDECMPALAIEKGYITETDKPEDVRLYMLSAENAAKLLSYYYTGSEEYMTAEKETDSEDYKRIYDASKDKGKFVIRVIDTRAEDADGKKRYTNFMSTRPGDCMLLTFPNGENMLIDTPAPLGLQKLMRDLENYLESAKKAGINDGNSIDNIMVSHWHVDHDGCIADVIDRFDVKNVFILPFNMTNLKRYNDTLEAVERKNKKYAEEGRPPINVIRLSHDDVYCFGEGDDKTEMYIMGPRDGCFKDYTLEELRQMAENGDYNTKVANGTSISARFSYKGQKFISCGDILHFAERVMVNTYGKEFLECEVLKINHHGYAGCNSYIWANACNPDVVIQNLSTLANPTMARKYFEGKNTAKPGIKVYQDGRAGAVRVELDGERVLTETQFVNRAYER